jgi:hypothetical protein
MKIPSSYNNIFKTFLFIFLIKFVCTINLNDWEKEEGTKLDFPHYTIIKSPNFENKFKSATNRCEFKTDCSHLDSIEKQNCIFKCVSSKCFEEIYSLNPLEEGEFDQRFSSYKGCVSSEI